MVSFIIPARNEATRIGRTLTAIRAAAQGLPEPYEIIVADDGSTDRTGEIAAAHGATVVRVDNRQIAATRNAGARASKGDVLFFIDADTVATEPAVQAGVAAIRDGAVAGGCVFRFDDPLPFWLSALYPAAEICGRWLRLVGGCFLFCRRSAFDAVGGFREDYDVGEELLFVRAIKQQGRFVVPRPVVLTSGRRLECLRGWRGPAAVLLLAKFILVRPSRRTMRQLANLGGYGPDAPRPGG
jgi:glycosyltransferase involved in cell wall biosynthesis